MRFALPLFFCVLLLSQIFLFYYLHSDDHFNILKLRDKFTSYESSLDNLANENKRLHNLILALRVNRSASLTDSFLTIPVLLLVCDRIELTRTLDHLLSYRSVYYKGSIRFPIYVSQDCSSLTVTKILAEYADDIIHLRQPDQSPIQVPTNHIKLQGYYHIARHYKWALEQVFTVHKHKLVIIVEDDLDIAPDFFDYFAASHSLLLNDSSLLCVSAWNDNGKKNLIDTSKPDLLYRSHFFPGLGWMLTDKLWAELRLKWPSSFWDEFMRTPEVRKDRACIRPEVSRTYTFGRVGVSKGQFFDRHLRFIHLNTLPVAFTSFKPELLWSSVYDNRLQFDVYNSSQAISLDALGRLETPNANDTTSYRLEYITKTDFLIAAKYLGIMSDFKYGVPRTAYRGIISVFFRNRRVFLSPPQGWTKYDLSWT